MVAGALPHLSHTPGSGPKPQERVTGFTGQGNNTLIVGDKSCTAQCSITTILCEKLIELGMPPGFSQQVGKARKLNPCGHNSQRDSVTQTFVNPGPRPTQSPTQTTQACLENLGPTTSRPKTGGPIALPSLLLCRGEV